MCLHLYAYPVSVIAMKESKTYEKATIQKLPNSEVEISVVISADVLDAYKKQALEALQHTLEIDGFRKGKAPLEMVEKQAGDGLLLKEASERALQRAYPHIITDNNIDAIGYPSVSIKKLAWGNPLEVTFKTTVVPDIKLPDYKKIAESHQKNKSTDTFDVTDKEINDVLLELRKSKAHSEWHKTHPDDTDHANHPDFNKEENLPPLNDEFAQGMGAFKSLDDLKKQVRENIRREKETKEIEKKRIALFDELIDKTDADVPNILVESEMAKMLGGLKDDVARAGMTFEDYLKQIKKTEEDIRKEWRVGAERRAKMQLVFNEIAKQEKIEADPKIVEEESKKLLEMYKDAEPERARVYVETTLINEQVVKLLEGNTPDESEKN